MSYYVIQVLTRDEQKFIRLAGEAVRDRADTRIFWPRRQLFIRRRGKVLPSLAPIFPGYVFLETDELDADLTAALRRSAGFVRFLRSNQNIQALDGTDRLLLQHFLSFGEVVRASKVVFDADRRIRVLQGPLKGLEGQVIKVDKRKGRAKVRLSIYDERFLVDFGIEMLQPAEGHEETPR